MDPVTPIRNLIEEPVVESDPTWVVALVLLVVLVVATLLFYGTWPWRRKNPNLDIARAIDTSSRLKPRFPRTH
ncbi:MAG: hypothetical protein V1895_02435 [Parcubacteria group bacterium]